jgi:hypothetical protein
MATTTFDGSNWQDLIRLVSQARLKFILDSAKDESELESADARCAYLAGHFTGPALDWVGAEYERNSAIFSNYDGFLVHVRNAFGISDEGLAAQRRNELEGLKWGADLPTFFAEFDRLTQLLQLTSHETRIALVRNKLPVHVQKLLAEQALNFANYDTMRERLLVMWSLDPARSIGAPGSSAPAKKRHRCGRCGKKGHAASDCRAKN